MMSKRRYPIGVEILGNKTDVRVYAPRCKQVELVVEDSAQKFSLIAEKNGYFSGSFKELKEGTLYRFCLDKQQQLFPDPASRFQPSGPFGPSQIIDSKKFKWSDQQWRCPPIDKQIIYEMHIGTFTKEGTLSAAAKELKELKKLGITLIELMPVNDFAGEFGWGYDGVNLFAPTRLYGTPDDLRRFINQAHRLELGVILDVVYNHFGSEGNFIENFSKDYMSELEGEWGRDINFDHPDSRLFFLTNVKYWIEEFHLDGLRIDATQCLRSSHSSKNPHIIKDICTTAHRAGKGRRILVIGENESQHAIINKPLEEGGYGYDALWNDDFHHSAMVRLTGRREAYYTDYQGKPQEFISALKYGYLYQGQYYTWQLQNRGTPSLNHPPTSFITFIQNHDQIANSGTGERIDKIADRGNLKTMTALLLLGTNVPMLFQGQEFGSSSPFFYFADRSQHSKDPVINGRKEFLSQFLQLATDETQNNIPDPTLKETYLRSKLDLSERFKNSMFYQLHKDLISLRKNDSVISNLQYYDGAVLSEDAFILRYFEKGANQRLLLFNFGVDLVFSPSPEPLLVPPEGHKWEMLWSSESIKYGGQGVLHPIVNCIWNILGHTATVLRASKI